MRRINLVLEWLAQTEEHLQISEPCPPFEIHACLLSGTSHSLYVVIDASDRVLSEQARVLCSMRYQCCVPNLTVSLKRWLWLSPLAPLRFSII